VKCATVASCLALSLSGCSYTLSLALYNNTPTDIVICNLHLRSNACQVIPAHSVAAVLLGADEPVETLTYRISTGDVVRTYQFPGISLWNLRSPHRCKVIGLSPCVAVQYEPNGNLYWIDSADRLPSASPPSQPEGFPIVPGA
jgi:hypothetical protein